MSCPSKLSLDLFPGAVMLLCLILMCVVLLDSIHARGFTESTSQQKMKQCCRKDNELCL